MNVRRRRWRSEEYVRRRRWQGDNLTREDQANSWREYSVPLPPRTVRHLSFWCTFSSTLSYWLHSSMAIWPIHNSTSSFRALSNSEWYFPKSKTAAAAIPFSSQVNLAHSITLIVWCLSCSMYIKFGSNIHHSRWDQHTYAPDVHFMISHELTSGFDFWSRGDLRIDVAHLPSNFGAKILYPIWSYWHFSEIQNGGHRHLGFSVYVNLAIPACWQSGICVQYQICFKYLL